MSKIITEQTASAERPLVTFALFTYNQEKYIKEAVDSALAQTYEPLEIILSDDGSTDNTFNIIKNIVEDYNGPHSIRLVRNEKNMGISRHVRHVHEVAKGDIIIHAAGDDISYPERTSKIVEVFYNSSIRPSLVMSNAHVINDEGDLLGLFSKEKNLKAEAAGDPTDFTSIGSAATYAISKDLVNMYPHPLPEIYGEDRVILNRAKLSEGFIYTPEVLVKYRISENGVWSSTFLLDLSNEDVIKRQMNRAADYINIMRQLLIDINFSKRSDKKKIEEKSKIVTEEKLRMVNLLRGSFLSGISSILFEQKNKEAQKQLMKLFAIRWFPFVRTIKKKLFNKSKSHPALQSIFKN